MAIKNRFIFYETNALIEDYMFYADHEAEIDNWLDKHDCVREGMNIHFFEHDTMILFKLTWL
jgi:hypothetical protein